MRNLTFLLVASVIATGSLTQSGMAFPQFHKEFVDLYVKTDDVQQGDGGKASTAPDAAKEPTFAELATGAKTKCFVCHQGKKKKDRNPYGIALSELLTKKDKKDTEKIVKALKAVDKIHTNPKDEKSPTYGELIKAGKLPGGSLEDAMKSPKDRWPPDGEPKMEAPADGSAKKGASGKKP